MQGLFGRPAAAACVRGSGEGAQIRGTVKFYPKEYGTLVVADICGLPETETNFFGFHIHEGTDCGGEKFADTGGHYNPCRAEHPMHAGDLPPLLGCKGRAFLAVVTGRFRAEEIVGRTVVIHGHPDDFHSQPAGDAGMKIACGVIRGI